MKLSLEKATWITSRWTHSHFNVAEGTFWSRNAPGTTTDLMKTVWEWMSSEPAPCFLDWSNTQWAMHEDRQFAPMPEKGHINSQVLLFSTTSPIEKNVHLLQCINTFRRCCTSKLSDSMRWGQSPECWLQISSVEWEVRYRLELIRPDHLLPFFLPVMTCTCTSKVKFLRSS